MSKILVIPPTTYSAVRKRLTQIGLTLSEHYQVYMLHWTEPKNKSFIERARVTLKDVFKKSKVYERNGFLFAEYPFFHYPLFMIKYYNPYSLEKFLIKHNIDIVINGLHYFFPTPKLRRCKYKHIFDVNDLPAEDTESHLSRFVYNFAEREAQKADVTVACSRGLVDYIQEHFNRKACFIPNGTYLEEFRSIDYEQIRKIRQRYNLLNKFVIGYIGYIGNWIDVDFLISFFKALKSKYDDVALMIVGGGPQVNFYKQRVKDENIVFTGGICSDKITPYFFSIDMGVLPSKKSLFQDLAFHTKLIEYTAAKKMVISPPLEEVKKLAFPNIFIADLYIEEWIKAIEKIRQIKWNPEWDRLVEPYDWKNIVNKLYNIIGSTN